MRRQAVWFGEGRASGQARYWESGAVASDYGTAIPLVGKTATLYPVGRSGETLFRRAYLSVHHVASAVLRVTPVVEGSFGAVSVTTGTVAAKPVIITLPQQLGEARTAVYPVPLVMEFTRANGDTVRASARGVGLALLIETVGAIGNGILSIDHVEVEHEPIAKTQGEAVAT